MNEFYNKHYISIDDRNRVIDGFSDAFRKPQKSDICINEQGGYQFRLFPGGEENPQLRDIHGVPLYKWDGEKVVRRSDDEIEADRPEHIPPVPTDKQRIKALELALSKIEPEKLFAAQIETGVTKIEEIPTKVTQAVALELNIVKEIQNG